MNAKEVRENTIKQIKDAPKYKEIIELIDIATYKGEFKMDTDQKYKGKATVSLGEEKVDVFDVTEEQVKNYWKSFGYGGNDLGDLA